ncbi:MAG: dihydroxyacetone kinase subunit DhaL [Coriobacteriales bacterium]|nr:dihydroxyacetone kinase subunit DhaL [Coriobacteriales bacterium]
MATRVYDCIKRIGDKIIENKDFLTDLDREIGDADHGVNMARGFTAAFDRVPQDEPNMGVALKKCGMALLSTVGGASGPLYGTAYMEAAKALAGKEALSADDFAAALDAAIAGIQKRGKAVAGEKTMLDALMPARDAYAQKIAEGGSLGDGLECACVAAWEGVEYTKTIAATKGRASYLGERSIGHQDPGATSATMTLEAIRDFIKE